MCLVALAEISYLETKMAKFIFVFIAVCIFQVYGRASAPSKDHIVELNKETQSVVKHLTDEFHRVSGIEETQELKELNKAFHSTMNDLAEKMTGVMKHFKTEYTAHSSEVENAVNSLKDKINDAVKKIQDDHPTETAKVHEYQKKVEELYHDVAGKVKTAADAFAKEGSGIHEDAAKFTEKLMSEFKTNAEHMGKEIKKVIDEHQKTHGH